MAENTFTTDYELNTSQAQAELNKVQKQIGGITSSLKRQAEDTEAGIKRLTVALQEMVSLYKQGTVEAARAQAKADSIASSFYNRRARGTVTTDADGRVTRDGPMANQINRSTSQALINDIQNSTAAMTAKVTDAIVKQMTTVMRSTQEAVEARIRTAQFGNSQAIANGDQNYLYARAQRATRQRQTTIAVEGDGDLINAQELRRQRNRNRLVDSQNDSELLAAQEVAATKARARTIEAAEDTEFNSASEKRRQRNRSRVVDTENDAELLAAQEVNASKSRSRAIESANDVAFNSANEKRRQRNRSELVEVENDEELLTAKRRQALTNRQKVIDTANDTDAAQASAKRKARTRQQQIDLENDETYLLAQQKRFEKNRADTIYASQYGQQALQSKRTNERLNYNGGADLMGIQGRVMLNYAAVGTLFSGAKSLVSNLVELDNELHQFQAISASSNTEMVGFKQNLVDISKQVPFTTLEIAKAATTLAQAGLSTKQINDSLASIATLATASGSDLNQAVDVVTSSMTAFNLETSRTGDVANVFTSALNLSKLSIDKLITSFNYIGPTAEAMGLTLEETTSILGALSQSGIRASTIGTGFRALLTDLQSPSKKLTEALKAAGLSIADIDVKTRGFLPVIETLKASGFGAAAAYESLETRSAAAYLALANNTKLAYDMQKAFSLSSAALEANQIQMESLTNSSKRLGNSINAAFMTAFDPIVNMLAKATSTAADAFGVLSEFPNLLKVIGIAATTVGTVMAVSLGISLFRSLSTAIPVIGTATMGIRTLSTAILSATTVTEGLSAAMAVLQGISKGGWIGIVATAAVAATAAFFAWHDSTDKLTKQIEALQARTKDLSGAADEAATKMGSIDTAIQALIDRKAELDKNPLMKDAKIDEIRSQFHELGLSIKDSTLSVTELIEKLLDLKQTSANIRAAQLGEAAGTQEETIAALQKKQQELLDPNGKMTGWVRYSASTLTDGVNAGAVSHPDSFFINELGKQFGPQIAEAIKLGLGDLGNFSKDPAGAVALPSVINSKISDLRLHPTEQSPDQIAFLQDLQKQIAPLIEVIATLAKTQIELGQTKSAAGAARVQASDSFKTLGATNAGNSGEVDRRTADINSDTTKTKAQKLEALQALQSWYKDVSDQALAKFKTDFAAEQGTNPALAGLDPTAETDLQSAIGPITTSIQGQILKIAAEDQKLLQKVLKKQATENSKKMAALERDISAAQNEDAFDIAKKGFDTFMAESRAQVNAYYDELIKAATAAKADPDTIKQIEDDRDAFNEEMDDKTAERQRDNIRKENDLLKAALGRQRDAVEDNIKTLRLSIEEAEAQLKKTPPGDAMNALVQKIKALYVALGNQMSTVAGIDTQVSGLNLNTPLSPAVAGSGNSATNYFIQRGLSKAGAAAVAGNISNESSFNPNLVGDHGTAYGVAQWRFDRQDALRSFAADAKKPANDLNTQYDFLLHELELKFPELLKRLQSGTEDPQTLAAAFMNEYEKPNKDPSINHIDRRKADAQSFYAGADTAPDAVVKKGQSDVDRQATVNTNKFVSDQQDAIIGSLKDRLGNLKTQVRFSDSTKSLSDLQGQVQKTYDDLVYAELKKFDADNADLKKDNPAGFDSKRKELIKGLHDNMNADIQKVMEEYYKAAEEQLQKPVDAAKAKLSAAQQPDVASKYTASDIQSLEQGVVNAQREASVQHVLLMEQEIAAVREKASAAETQYGPDSSEALQWRTLENDLIAKNTQLKVENNAVTEAMTKQAPSVTEAIKSATVAWEQQNGIRDAKGDLIPMAQQVGSAWGQVLDGLNNGFSTFFTNIASGTMTAGEAFKQLGTTILQMFAQIIAKALANQIIESLFTGGAGGIFGDLGKGLFGIVGKATGGEVAGRRRAATGTSVAPFRDGGSYQLMPGEYVLRQSAVQAIGTDKLDQLNNLGNRQISQGALSNRVSNDNNQQGAGVVNVWVVSQDQVPQSGPNDIIATVADNISRRGTIKQLIQQVQMGAI